jgi:predicted metal-binding protein
MVQTSLFGGNDDDFFLQGSETIVEYSFIKQTKKLTVPIQYKQNLIPYEKLKSYFIEGRELRCQHGNKPCNGYNRCYGCPPLNPTLEKYNVKGYGDVLVYCFSADMTSFALADRLYRYQNASRTLSPLAKHYGRWLENTLGGKDMIDGHCQICKPCNASIVPRKPCNNPEDLRCSLESLGLNVVALVQDVLNHEIKWWFHSETRKEEPPYLTVVHGLLTNSKEPKLKVVQPYFKRLFQVRNIKKPYQTGLFETIEKNNQEGA